MLFDELLQDTKTSDDTYQSGKEDFWHPQPIWKPNYMVKGSKIKEVETQDMAYKNLKI